MAAACSTHGKGTVSGTEQSEILIEQLELLQRFCGATVVTAEKEAATATPITWPAAASAVAPAIVPDASEVLSVAGQDSRVRTECTWASLSAPKQE